MIFFWLVFAILVGVLGSNRKIGFGWAFFWSVVFSPLIGLFIVLFSDNNSTKSSHKYKDHLELGERAVFKGQFVKAVDHYMDSLYHLENDYKKVKLNKQLEEKRQQRIAKIIGKIDNIKSNNSSLFSDASNNK